MSSERHRLDQSLIALFGDTYSSRSQHEKDLLIDAIIEERVLQTKHEVREKWKKVNEQYKDEFFYFRDYYTDSWWENDIQTWNWRDLEELKKGDISDWIYQNRAEKAGMRWRYAGASLPPNYIHQQLYP
jgi:uncharacterized iron-regulated protein